MKSQLIRFGMMLCLVCHGFAEERLFPSDAGMVNVKNYNARGDGVTDDTTAIQNAINFAIERWVDPTGKPFVYFPSGTYLVSRPLQGRVGTNTRSFGWRDGMLLMGQDETTTTIRLKDYAPGFNLVGSPLPVIRTGSETNSGINNLDGSGCSGFRHGIINLTVNTGVGNPGAVGIDFLANNRSCIEDVTIRSEDGTGVSGVSMMRYATGPALMKRVHIYGFDTGIRLTRLEASMTLEHITLVGQNRIGIWLTDNVLNIRDLVSSNTVPVMSCSGGAQATLVDGTFTGGAPTNAAIINGAKLHLRNVSSRGYFTPVTNAPGFANAVPYKGPAGYLDEYVSRPAVSLFPSPLRSLNLPIEETPEFHTNDFSQWASVRAFGATPDNNSDDDWKGIQEAIDSGRPVVYLPRGEYRVSRPIVLRGEVRKLAGMNSMIGTNANYIGGSVIRFEEGGAEACTLEHLRIRGWVEHASTNALALRHLDLAEGGYRNSRNGTGKAFFEDVMIRPVLIQFPQPLWARQLDLESSYGINPSPLIENHGGQLWILGVKVEGPETIIKTVTGCTEVLGGLTYPIVTNGLPLFINDSSSVSLTYLVTQSIWPLHMREMRNGEIRQLWHESKLYRGVPLYVSIQETGLPGTAQPALTPEGTNFLNSVTVSAVCDTESAAMYYTTDGSAPTTNSTLYTGSLTFTNTTILNVRAFAPEHSPSATVTGTFTKVRLSPALTPAQSTPGLVYRYFQGNFGSYLPDFTKLTPVKTGTVSTFSLTPRQQTEYYAFEYSGFLNVPVDGFYTFYLKSDDGSHLYVDGVRVVNNDGVHDIIEASGRAALQAGKHQIVVTYFQGWGGASLTVEYAGPGLSRRTIPPSALSQGILISALEPELLQGHLEMEYTRWLPTAGRTYSFESSSDLVEWEPATLAEINVLRSTTCEQVFVRDSTLAGGSVHRFYRLRVD